MRNQLKEVTVSIFENLVISPVQLQDIIIEVTQLGKLRKWISESARNG